MTEETLPGRDPMAATYLEQLQELASEISVATDAISANQMLEFRDSVARQEQLCHSLTAVSHQVSAALTRRGQPSGPRIDGQLEQRIRAACAELQDLNFKYKALLRHSGRSIVLLSLLCKSQTGEFFTYGEPKRQTWSCEV